jgi:hypothetical protein
MASPKGGNPIESGIITRLTTGVRYALSGKTYAEFFGPGQPIAPAAQEQAHGRAFDYDTNFNITTRPRGNEPIDFPTLRALADGYDLIRLAIETRKDQMGKLRWQIVKKTDGKKTPGKKGLAEQDATALAIQEFLQEPDGEHDFLDWSRMLYEDLLVIDAPAVYIRPTLGGQVFALEQIDGATIARKLDGRGRTPPAPKKGETFDPAVHTAYQQIIKGLPATDYHADELIYRPRNPRVQKVYGYSPVEQIIVIVNIGLRRQAHQLSFYTAGNIPEMLMATPATWTPDNIAKFQKLWDQLMAGDLEARRQLKFVPGDLKPLPLRPEKSLFDAFDEWLARVVSYAFSLPPTAFVKQVNRATATTAQDVALEEGLAPLMEWKVRFMNTLIRKAWGTSDYEFKWLDEDATDPLIQAEVDNIYVTAGIRLPNEVREDHGWEKNPVLDERKLAPPTPPPGSVPPGDEKKTPATKDDVAAATEKLFGVALSTRLDAFETRLAEKVATDGQHASEAVKKVTQESMQSVVAKIDAVETRIASSIERIELERSFVASIDELRAEIEKKSQMVQPTPTKPEKAMAAAKLAEFGAPLNAAMKAMDLDLTVPDGNTSFMSAGRIPTEMAADTTLFEQPPQKVEKRSEPVPTMEFNPTFHITMPALPEPKATERTITMTKADGVEVTARVTDTPKAE